MENINKTPNFQPTEPSQSVSLVKNQNTFKVLFIISLFVIIGIIIAFYFVLNNKIDQLSNKQTVDITSIPTQKINISNETTPTSIPTIASTESTLVQKDANNNLYTNNKFDFSLVVPKLAVGTIECKKEHGSYIPVYGLVPITFFENDDTIYLAANNFYSVTYERSDHDFSYKSSRCEKLKTTFDLIEKVGQEADVSIASLKIYAANIKNDNELEQFIKTKYGSGCKLGEKVDGEGDFSIVKITGDGKPYDETKCRSNGVKVTYNQIKNKAVLFEVGQSYEPLDGVSSSLKFL